MPMAVPLAIISSGRKMNLATMLIMVAMRERRMPGTLRLISIRRSTFRLCPGSNANFDPEHIGRFNVQISGDPGILPEQARMLHLKNLL